MNEVSNSERHSLALTGATISYVEIGEDEDTGQLLVTHLVARKNGEPVYTLATDQDGRTEVEISELAYRPVEKPQPGLFRRLVRWWYK